MVRYILVPYIVAIAIFFCLFSLMSSFVDPPTCRDGWRSSSIGTQGACSHHGGVEYDPVSYFVLPISFTATLFSFFLVSGTPFIAKGTRAYLRKGKVFCPECDSEMQSRNGRYGLFFGCTKYPQCKSTLNIDQGEKIRE